MSIDYMAAAELFPSRRYAKSLARYRRFASAAEAVRYAVEDMPAAWLIGTFLDIAGVRFEGRAIRGLYDADGYPGQRRS
ncbi:MAG: hypothetical protein ABIQ30_01635 [Devosia sp.]